MAIFNPGLDTHIKEYKKTIGVFRFLITESSVGDSEWHYTIVLIDQLNRRYLAGHSHIYEKDDWIMGDPKRKPIDCIIEMLKGVDFTSKENK